MKCEKCGVELNNDGYCPVCGNRYISICEDVDFRDGHGLRKKDGTIYKSKRHNCYYEEKNTYEFNRDRSSFVMRHKVEDRLNHRYEEDVETLDGEIIHTCHESLLDHTNHGYAKEKNKQ